MTKQIHDQYSVVGLCGSLRAASYNMSALETAGRLMPSGMALRVGTFSQVPIYCPDEQERGWPATVVALGQTITQADAVLIASPEYNFSVPGGLKNVLDWLSRLPDQPFRGKPVAIMGAATGPVGTARMQYDLRKILHSLDAQVLLKPEIFIGQAKMKFDADGRLIDEVTLQFIKDQMVALQLLIGRGQTSSRAQA